MSYTKNGKSHKIAHNYRFWLLQHESNIWSDKSHCLTLITNSGGSKRFGTTKVQQLHGDLHLTDGLGAESRQITPIDKGKIPREISHKNIERLNEQ